MVRTKSAILAFRAKAKRLQMDAVYSECPEYREQEQNKAGDCKALWTLVDEHLRSCLPPGTPPSYREIVGARVEGRDRKQIIAADLVMFDGLPAVVVMTRWSLGWSHRFHMGASVYWEEGRWHREPEPHPDLFSALPASPLSLGEAK